MFFGYLKEQVGFFRELCSLLRSLLPTLLGDPVLLQETLQNTFS